MQDPSLETEEGAGTAPVATVHNAEHPVTVRNTIESLVPQPIQTLGYLQRVASGVPWLAPKETGLSNVTFFPAVTDDSTKRTVVFAAVVTRFALAVRRPNLPDGTANGYVGDWTGTGYTPIGLGSRLWTNFDLFRMSADSTAIDAFAQAAESVCASGNIYLTILPCANNGAQTVSGQSWEFAISAALRGFPTQAYSGLGMASSGWSVDFFPEKLAECATWNLPLVVWKPQAVGATGATTVVDVTDALNRRLKTGDFWSPVLFTEPKESKAIFAPNWILLMMYYMCTLLTFDRLLGDESRSIKAPPATVVPPAQRDEWDPQVWLEVARAMDDPPKGSIVPALGTGSAIDISKVVSYATTYFAQLGKNNLVNSIDTLFASIKKSVLNGQPWAAQKARIGALYSMIKGANDTWKGIKAYTPAPKPAVPVPNLISKTATLMPVFFKKPVHVQPEKKEKKVKEEVISPEELKRRAAREAARLAAEQSTYSNVEEFVAPKRGREGVVRPAAATADESQAERPTGQSPRVLVLRKGKRPQPGADTEGNVGEDESGTFASDVMF